MELFDVEWWVVGLIGRIFIGGENMQLVVDWLIIYTNIRFILSIDIPLESAYWGLYNELFGD